MLSYSGFIIYFCIVVVAVVILIFQVAPRYGKESLLVYIAVCSLAGSLTVCHISFCSLTYAYHTCPLKFIQSLCVGHGRKSSRDCFEAVLWREKSIQILPNLDVSSARDRLCSCAAELFEQGKFMNLFVDMIFFASSLSIKYI